MAFVEQTISKIISIPATNSLAINALGPISVNSFEQRVRGGGVQDAYMIYEFYNEDSNNIYFLPKLAAELGTNITVKKVELVFWHNQADLDDPIKSLDFVDISGVTRPLDLSHNTLWNDVRDQTGGKFLSQEIHGLGKVMTTVTLGEAGSSAATAATDMITAGTTELWFAVGISRTASSTSEEGTILLGGNTLLHGEGTAWETADSSEINALPRLIVTYENTSGGSWSQFFMHYTTSDPTTSQATPSNSLGAHRATNEVYVNSQLEDDISSTSTTVTLLSGATLPETSGMVQIGSEIMKYSSIDNTNKILQGVSRGIVPTLFPTPSSIEPYREYANFLEIDRLFDRRPTSGLVQYRCVSFLYDDTSTRVQKVKAILVQNADEDVQIDIGIEVPEYDSRTGVTLDTVSTTFTSDDVEVRNLHRSKGAIPDGSDLFEDGYVVFDPGATDTIAQITSFDISDGVATFIIDRDLTASGFGIGTAFRINPGPCQIISNEIVAPVENSGRFFGFFGDGGSNLVGFNNVKERNDWMINYDVFYLWVKRTLTKNKKTSTDTGALVLIEFDDTVRQAL